MLYCSQNCQLKSNTWNTAARAGAAPPLHALPTRLTTPPPPFAPETLVRDKAEKRSASLHRRGPWRMFFFPSPSFFSHSPSSLSLFMKSCRQRTFTSTHAAHKSAGVAALLLLNRINKGGRFLGGAYGRSVNLLRATLLKTKTAVILSSACR